MAEDKDKEKPQEDSAKPKLPDKPRLVKEGELKGDKVVKIDHTPNKKAEDK